MRGYVLQGSREEVLEAIRTLGLEEYGLAGGLLADRLTAVQQPDALIAALNNGDTDGVLLQVLDTEADHVFAGMLVAARAAGAQRCVLYLPEGEEELARTIRPRAEEKRIQVVCGFLNPREHRRDVIVHLVTMARLACALEGTPDDGVYLSIDGRALIKADSGQTLAELTDTACARAVFTGVRLLGPDAVSVPVTDLPLENGVVRLLRGGDCAVQTVAQTLKAARARSCGRCVFCREGLIQLDHMLGEIMAARGRWEHTELLGEIGEVMCDSTLCTLGQTAARPVLSLLDVCGEETSAHIKKKECPAGACAAFTHIYIDPLRCTGCEECTDVCPKGCIEGRAGFIHMIDEFDCDKCGKCVQACEEEAVVITAGRLPRLPERLTRVGRFRK